jgi:succinate-semialdehyde dehydrogenase/glutarate-semialdehyde dehydrogenase
MSISKNLSEQAVIDGVKKQLFIGGEWRDVRAGGTFPVEDPATGEVLCAVADAQPDDARAALDAAVAVQGAWAKYPPRLTVAGP